MLRSISYAVACAGCLLLASPADAHPAHSLPGTYNYYFRNHNSYHRQVLLLDQQILVRKAEIAALERLLAEWEPFDRFRNGRPLVVSIENTKLMLMRAKYDLESLQQELFDLVRSRGVR